MIKGIKLAENPNQPSNFIFLDYHEQHILLRQESMIKTIEMKMMVFVMMILDMIEVILMKVMAITEIAVMVAKILMKNILSIIAIGIKIMLIM